jgi:hypothetical protein
LGVPRGNKWKIGFELLGASLVAIGVAGELGVDVKSGTIQTALRSKNGELTQLLEGAASTALREAAHLTSENLKLEALIQPRSLTPKQRDDIVGLLRPFKGRNIIIVSHAYDPDGYWFARQLIAVFKGAFLTVDDRVVGLEGVSGMGSFNTETGTVVGWSPDQKDLGGKIGEALDKIARVRQLTTVPMQGTGQVFVTVNWKPLESQ